MAHHFGGLVELARDLADRVGQLIGGGRRRSSHWSMPRSRHDARWSARCEVWSEAASSLVAVAFIVTALSPTDLSNVLDPFAEVSDRGVDRAALALQLDHRRRAAARSLRCSVTSSCVATQPPAAIGGMTTLTMRPSLASMVQANGFPFATLSRMFRQYSRDSPWK
jgi:hypothetical protein